VSTAVTAMAVTTAIAMPAMRPPRFDLRTAVGQVLPQSRDSDRTRAEQSPLEHKLWLRDRAALAFEAWPEVEASLVVSAAELSQGWEASRISQASRL
jgi:hypothetical protein